MNLRNTVLSLALLFSMSGLLYGHGSAAEKDGKEATSSHGCMILGDANRSGMMNESGRMQNMPGMMGMAGMHNMHGMMARCRQMCQEVMASSPGNAERQQPKNQEKAPEM